jgi:transcriptional regulator with XRE-family HTH domain
MPPIVKRDLPHRPPLVSEQLVPAHLRAARGLLGWSQVQLAGAAGVSLRALKTIELAPETTPAPGRPATLARLIGALRAAGVDLTRTADRIGATRTIQVRTPGDTPGE